MGTSLARQPRPQLCQNGLGRVSVAQVRCWVNPIDGVSAAGRRINQLKELHCKTRIENAIEIYNSHQKKWVPSPALLGRLLHKEYGSL
ncbi:hypothetical protein WN50_38995 [Limnoraphis robusta CS-951]|uniref:Uncharacterized protein n=1 Tax=Limnoraphis robusta CS-951 TaxID=1637645 RepID=A0A0J9EXT7_9CYAN|nr:hypothetical protein WN50_38995 [Limnoraphis robusta CS-951]